MSVVRFYSDEAVSGRALQRAAKLCPQLSVSTELCYNVELTGERPAACRVIIILIIGQVRFCKQFALHSTLMVLLLLLFPSCFLLQTPRVSAPSRRRFSSGCFVLPSRRSRCLKRRNSLMVPAASWWRSDPGTRLRFIKIIDPLCHSVRLHIVSERL